MDTALYALVYTTTYKYEHTYVCVHVSIKLQRNAVYSTPSRRTAIVPILCINVSSATSGQALNNTSPLYIVVKPQLWPPHDMYVCIVSV